MATGRAGARTAAPWPGPAHPRRALGRARRRGGVPDPSPAADHAGRRYQRPDLAPAQHGPGRGPDRGPRWRPHRRARYPRRADRGRRLVRPAVRAPGGGVLRRRDTHRRRGPAPRMTAVAVLVGAAALVGCAALVVARRRLVAVSVFGRWMIKRVAALPGDPVPRQAVPMLAGRPEDAVPPAMLVLLGDNGSASYDSRQVGYFPADRLLGVAVRKLPPVRDQRRWHSPLA